jgi:hypothetical protein
VLTATRDPVIDSVVSTLSQIRGVAAIALGGSRSIGTANERSDYDIVIFERALGDIDEPALRRALEQLTETPLKMTVKLALAETTIGGNKVEFFFRVINGIAKEIEAARNGQFRRWPNALHAAGYLSTAIISYATYALPIWDPEGHLRRLVESAHPYPDALRNKMISTFKMEAALSLMHAAKVRAPDELPYVSGLYSRAVFAWTIILFAANGRYPIIDKGAMKLIMSFPKKPERFKGRANKLFRDIGAGDLQQARIDAAQLHREITGDMPKT